MNRRPRIVFVGLASEPEVFLSRLLEGLLQKDFFIIHASSHAPKKSLSLPWLILPPLKKIQIENYFYFFRDMNQYAYNYLISLLKTKFSIKNARSLLTQVQIKKVQPNLIYFPWNSGAVSYASLLQIHIPVLISCRGAQVNIAPLNPKRKNFTQEVYHTLEKATAIHCVSENIKTQLSHQVKNKNTRVIYPAVPIKSNPTPAITSSPFTITTVGSLIWRKGLEHLVLAFSQFQHRRKDTILNIIGGGEDFTRIQYAIHDLGMSNSIHLLGKKSPSQVQSYLESSHLFVLSSFSEGISNALLEAMAHKLPVITFSWPGVQEVITHKINGWLVDMYQTDQLSEAVFTLASDPALARSIGEKGYQTIKERFNLKDQINQFSALCIEVSR